MLNMEFTSFYPVCLQESILLRVEPVFARLEKYLNLEGFLEKSLKI